VIGANGRLVGYGGGIDKKTFLLKLEGVQSRWFDA
jgi:epoxyqueuosine reductase